MAGPGGWGSAACERRGWRPSSHPPIAFVTGPRVPLPQASRAHREYRLRAYTTRLRAQLALLRGEPASFPSQTLPQER